MPSDAEPDKRVDCPDLEGCDQANLPMRKELETVELATLRRSESGLVRAAAAEIDRLTLKLNEKSEGDRAAYRRGYRAGQEVELLARRKALDEREEVKHVDDVPVESPPPGPGRRRAMEAEWLRLLREDLKKPEFNDYKLGPMAMTLNQCVAEIDRQREEIERLTAEEKRQRGAKIAYAADCDRLVVERDKLKKALKQHGWGDCARCGKLLPPDVLLENEGHCSPCLEFIDKPRPAGAGPFPCLGS